MRASAVLLALSAANFGCSGDDITSNERPLVAELAGLTVEVTPAPARLVVRDGDLVLFDGLAGAAVPEDARIPEVGVALRQADADYETLYGSFKIEETDALPWRGVSRFANLRHEGDAVTFDLRDATGIVATAELRAAAERHLAVTVTAADPSHNRVSVATDCAPDEHFLGFGGQSFDVDHRGQTVPLWVQEDGIGKAEIDAYIGLWFLEGRRHSTHTPMPIYVSSRGYALALDTPYRSIFAMCSDDEDAVRIEAWEGEARLHLFAGPSPLEAIERVTAWTGRPDLPPPHAFAPWIDAIYGEDEVRRVAQKLRAEDVPVSVIWTEDWRGAKPAGDGWVLDEDWEVDRELYPDFEGLAADLHHEGFEFLIYHNSFLDSTVPVYDEAVELGHTIRDESGAPYLFEGVKFHPTTMLDLSSPDAVAWAKQKYRDSLELGADGYMADFAEWLPHDAVLASGEDALARHNLYPVDWQRLNRELFAEMQAEDGRERLFFVRSAYLGSQPLVSVVWAGDQQTDFSRGDGYPSVIPMGIGLGVTGFPYYGHDIGGYMSQGTEPTTRELWFRWVTLGALTPVMRTHHGREALVNWDWESDAASTAHFRRWARLHMQLWPYLYEHARRASATGAPMFRPLALDHPDFEPGWTATDQFLLGDRIVVAPVVEEGATRREVALPPGDFYPLLGGAPASGTIMAEAGIEDIPAFVPAGTVLVLLPPEVDTASEVGATSEAVTLASVGDDRELWLYPGGSSSFTEDERLGYAWSAGSLAAPPTAATFDGAPVELANDGGWLTAEVVGPGTLTFDDGSALAIDGGAADRRIRVRLWTGF